MTAQIRVLVADDERNLRELLVRELTRKGHAAAGVSDGQAALDRLAEEVPDVLLLDMKMPRVEGLEVLRALQAYPEAPQVIVMTGFQEVSTAVEAMKLGAYDYLTKPARIEELDILIRKAAEKGRLIRQNVAMRAQLDPDDAHGGIITANPAIEEVLRVVDRVAPTDSSVLILGESGTGKELIARAVHERSPRAAQAFVPIHCGALPREVLESELFGHEKGAFTGAVNAKPGLIELAEGGTLFLDEIGEMEPDSQVKLLRVLESHAFFRVGGTRRRTVDMRLVAATNRDLAEAIKTNEFRQDLYYRINTITVSLPPLRERREDIRLLVPYFLEQNAAYGRKRISAAALQCLEVYPWPGNVRELQHVIQRAVILCAGDEIQPQDLPAEVREGQRSTTPTTGSLEGIERQHIITILKQVGGHRAKAAALLGIDPKTLYRKILGYGISADAFK
jgi:DNA-binding NtrC family response regulator